MTSKHDLSQLQKSGFNYPKKTTSKQKDKWLQKTSKVVKIPYDTAQFNRKEKQDSSQ